MNAVHPLSRTDDTVTLRADDFEALLRAVEEAKDVAALFAAGAREDALGKAEARADHLPVEAVERLLAGEHPVSVWKEHRGLSSETLAVAAGLSPTDLADIEAGRSPGSVAAYRSLAAALAVTVDELVA